MVCVSENSAVAAPKVWGVPVRACWPPQSCCSSRSWPRCAIQIRTTSALPGAAATRSLPATRLSMGSQRQAGREAFMSASRRLCSLERGTRGDTRCERGSFNDSIQSCCTAAGQVQCRPPKRKKERKKKGAQRQHHSEVRATGGPSRSAHPEWSPRARWALCRPAGLVQSQRRSRRRCRRLWIETQAGMAASAEALAEPIHGRLSDETAEAANNAVSRVVETYRQRRRTWQPGPCQACQGRRQSLRTAPRAAASARPAAAGLAAPRTSPAGGEGGGCEQVRVSATEKRAEAKRKSAAGQEAGAEKRRSASEWRVFLFGLAYQWKRLASLGGHDARVLGRCPGLCGGSDAAGKPALKKGVAQTRQREFVERKSERKWGRRKRREKDTMRRCEYIPHRRRGRMCLSICL